MVATTVCRDRMRITRVALNKSADAGYQRRLKKLFSCGNFYEAPFNTLTKFSSVDYNHNRSDLSLAASPGMHCSGACQETAQSLLTNGGSMKFSKHIVSIALLSSILSVLQVHAQPMSAEIMTGHNYGTISMVMSKKFADPSKFGIFHMNIVQIDYRHNKDHDILLQDLLFFEPIENFKITTGAFYGGRPGFMPTAGMQFSLHKKAFFMLLSPRVNIQSDPEYDIFAIFKFEPALGETIKLCTSLQSLNLFDKAGNIKCGQDVRLGLNIKDFTIGLAAGIEEVGHDFEMKNNFGVFVQRDLL
jgi:hypothetical protein